MYIVKPGINIDFIGKRQICYGISVFLIFCGIISLVIHGGPNYGIDFAGGTLIQIKFNEDVKIADIQKGISSIELGNAAVQRFGEKENNEYLIRTNFSIDAKEDFDSKLKASIKSSTGRDVDVQRTEMVGPAVGKDLQEKALFAIFYSLLFITVYISGRFELKWMESLIIGGALMGVVYFLSAFKVSTPYLITVALIVSLAIFAVRELKYAIGAIVALIHDVLITVGLFSILDKEFTLQIIAAVLTIIGYSLNDTIIVFDRIRENKKKVQKKESLPDVINKSVNETLNRTILTSGTTLMVVLALFIFGGAIIQDFALAMLVGIVVGTYSSIYVASPILLIWPEKKR
ncbi:MAG: protein translocase subunit SecF [Desulfobacterales bacterium]|nr:protein translocase subunit SecF [Desulfobacterales bacterium]